MRQIQGEAEFEVHQNRFLEAVLGREVSPAADPMEVHSRAIGLYQLLGKGY
jgi:hypothetical protein